MKVLLMVPLTSLMKNHPNIPDLGLGYLAAAVRKAGFQADIFGWNNNLNINTFVDYLRKTPPKIVGIKVFTHNIVAALKTVSIIKSTNPSIITVIGGPHPSASDPEETMQDFEEVDFAFRGDAEVGFADLARKCSKMSSGNTQKCIDSKILKDIPGVIWRDNGIVRSNAPHFSEELDSLGFPAWDLINPKDYNFYRIDEDDTRGYVAPIIITRGCPLPCSYCSVGFVNGKKIRRRKNDAVIEEIELLYNKYNVRQLTIMDTSFLSDKESVADLCNLTIERGLQIKWDCICDTIDWGFYDDSILSLMYKAGCRKIIMGIESGSDKTLKTIKKSWDKKQFKKVVSLVKSQGIKVQGYFMFGFPYETIEDMHETRNFAFDFDFDRVFFNICFPLPGTGIFKYLKKKHKIERLDWKEFTVESSPYPVSEVNSKEMMGFLYQTELRYSFHSIKKYSDFLSPGFLFTFLKVIIKSIFLFIGFSKKIKQC